MKSVNKLIGLLIVVAAVSCTKVDLPEPAVIDLGTKATSTAIKVIKQEGYTINTTLETTPGAKYSIQVIPFGKEEPVKKEGFTASDIITTKSVDLSGLPVGYYDFILIDIAGKEAKYPIIIK